MKKTALEQIIVFCADVNRLVHFYQDCFGLEPEGEPDDQWRVMKAGPAKIAFHKIGDAWLDGKPEDFRADSNTKLVFVTGNDLAAFREELVSKQAAMGEIVQFPGVDFLVCDGHDPEGNVFQVKQYLPQPGV